MFFFFFSRDLFLSSKTNDWNVADDFHPLNLTDNDLLDDRRSSHDDEPEETYLTAFHQLLQTQQDLIQHHHQVNESENMLSTILEASCEDATPMTSLVDVHQHVRPEEIEELSEDEDTERPVMPTPSIDDLPVSTVFSKNESEFFHILFFVQRDVFSFQISIRFEIYGLSSSKTSN